MNIAVCTTQVPFVRGGAEVLIEGLVGALRAAGHRVTQIVLPFAWMPHAALVKSALVWRELDLSHIGGVPVDLVICTKFPTWLVRHPRKVVWLVHQHRQAYDWFGGRLSNFTALPEDRRVRRFVAHADRLGLGEAQRIFTISRNVARRLAEYTDLHGEALYPPLNTSALRNIGTQPYILSMSRLDRAKRTELLLDAMRHIETPVRAIIAGSGPELAALRSRIRFDATLRRTVSLPGRVGDAQWLDLYGNALAVFYAPVDEDYGYATLEGMAAGKPIITSADAGGVLEFVRADINGIITPRPDPHSFATAIDHLYTDQNYAAQLGHAGRALYDELDLTWDKTIAKLLA